MIFKKNYEKENQHSKGFGDHRGELPRCRFSPASYGLCARFKSNLTDRDDKDGGDEKKGEDHPVEGGQMEVVICNRVESDPEMLMCSAHHIGKLPQGIT